MIFNSFSFLIFFPTVFFFYYAFPKKFRVTFLLIASCVFYAAYVPAYLLILFSLITLDFFLAQLIEKRGGRQRLALLWVSVCANVGMLFFFKYWNFFNINIAALGAALHWNYSPALLYIALPLGLSFHIFQSLSYVIEVYRGKFLPERNYLIYALYVMFFPQLVAGPIERPQHLLPQFHKDHSFDPLKARRGLERMLWGFFKKLVIADNIAPFVNQIYASNTSEGPIIVLVAILFTYQIYCDFSGYSDIAVGTAAMLGYDIMENFDRPFAARSIAELWRRWHISLSSWLRDYLYYPLVFSRRRVTKIWLYASSIITFTLIGLWHGANWTFVVFGALQGLYITVGTATETWRNNFFRVLGFPVYVRHTLQVTCAFSLFALSLIFFRSVSLAQALHLTLHLGSDIWNVHVLTAWFTAHPIADKIHIATFVLAILSMELVQFWQTKLHAPYLFEARPGMVRFGWYYLLFFGIIILGHLSAQPFIYFKF
jgi:alginate O-acetyltransferase complex protein AlgI